MRRIRTRLALHFTYQLFLLWIAIILILVIGLLALIRYMVNQDLKRTFTTAAMDGIQTETFIDNNVVSISQRWEDLLKESGYWLQIINESGKVIYVSNAPSDLKKSYGAAELLNIYETRRLGDYQLLVSLVDMADGKKPALFVIGRLDRGSKQLAKWFNEYSSGGAIRPELLPELEGLLKQNGQFLQVINPQGQVLQSAGRLTESDVVNQEYKPLELVSMRVETGKYPTELSVYYDEASKSTWLFHQGKPVKQHVTQSMFYDMLMILVVLGASVLILTLAISIWHGYRYGQPLMLFTSWFERMSQGRYSEALTEKERRKVFRKNGKIRHRYRLYKEVIDGFYTMATRLDASQRERKMLEKTREEWMTGISHDLRTPLSTIQGYGHLLESGQFTWEASELEEMGRMIREKGDFMLELLQDFSLTFQLKNNAIQFPLEHVELCEFARRSVLRYVNDPSMDKASFAFEGDERPLMIRANPKWFQRMLDNLITNAVKHNSEGTLVTVATEIRDGQAMITVSDNGRGMDEETCKNLFQRYYRGTNTDERTDGAGLGMSIAHAIVMSHQGKIDVESDAESGTVIRLTFPLTSREDRGVSPTA